MDNVNSATHDTSGAKSSPHAKSTPRDIFLYLLMIVALYISVTSFMVLAFQFLNKILPQDLPFAGGVPVDGAIIGGLSALVVAWPVFILISWIISKQFKQDPSRQNIGVKRWLTYLTLFVSSVAIIITLIVLVTNFLNGELSLRAGLKIISTLVVAGGVLGYYMWELKNRPPKKFGLRKIVAIVSSLLALAGLVVGFIVVGGPTQQRAKRFDQQRVSDIQNGQLQIQDYFFRNNKLPKNLEQLVDGISLLKVPTDPRDGSAYQYEITGPSSFKLCATFETEQSNPLGIPEVKPIGVRGASDNLSHGVGYTCFASQVDTSLPPDLFTAPARP